ncbi:serine/threonine-protein kinase [Sorangium sp. So ce385]|uniref:serine/threonine-protein kinase n=1 Tax=Sorangium sp. So ce385 TaxID=3133308 RepID=UPI003F5BB029
MLPGRLLDDRFELAEVAGSGGMGTVYRALDRASGEVVAVKLLRRLDARAEARFLREAAALSRLSHPHIVRYVTHGVAPTGEPYLAMEWLSGESLADRLSRQELRVDESVALTRRVADALGAAHARGIVHRDIKPSNLFLVDGALDGVKLLDFGIALLADATSRLTGTSAVVGTLGYMAPEQARGDREALDGRADVFSLGCVLFECLTGQRAFRGQHLSVVWKLLLEDSPRARELRPDLPEALDALLARMLAKDPSERPEDGAAVVRCLEALGALEGSGAPSALPPPAAISLRERRLASVVAVRSAQPSFSATTESLDAHAPPPGTLAAVRRAALTLGAQVVELGDGIVAAVAASAGSATDQAALAARCALQVRALLPGAAVAVVTARGEPMGGSPFGEALAQAAALLDAAAAPARAEGRREGVVVDAATQALLDARFEVVAEGGLARLEAEREIGEGARRLLGGPSPYVGRERELQQLLELVDDSFTERRSAAALVTAAAGMGKSRLRREAVEALRQRHPGVALSVARGDALAGGAALALLAGALRSALGFAPGEAPAALRSALGSAPGEAPAALRARLAQALGSLLEGEEGRSTAAFLGELLGLPPPDEPPAALEAARRDPARMAEEIQRAYVDYARAVTGARPMLVVLEDLHGGDASSVGIFDRALRELGDRPYAVLAFARPEVHGMFPQLWAERGLSELRLRELPARAAEQLVRSALGASLAPEDVAALVQRAAGNAFCLEELVRAAAEGRRAPPEAALGLVEARIAALGPEARRLLRAASVFGEVCWAGGVRALLGAPAQGPIERAAWAELLDREILERRPGSRFPDEEELAFRHALLREAAYAMLTDRDRELGHKLAGAWLVRAGEEDAEVLAEHLARSRETGPRSPDRSLGWSDGRGRGVA